MKVRPALDGWEVPRIQSIDTLERRSLVELEVPGRVGNLFQDMNTTPTRIVIAGSLYGDEARDEFFDNLRTKYQAGDPVTFVADIVTATEVQYVVIETLRFKESSVSPDQIDYFFVIKESPPPPPPPDPLGGLDAGLLEGAGDFLDSVSGALDLIDSLGSIPDIGDPTPPLQNALAQVEAATSGLDAVANELQTLFG